MKVEFDKTGGLVATITGSELFRIGRGDQVEFGDQIPHAKKITLRCDSPQSLELVEDLRVVAREFERRVAILELQQLHISIVRDHSGICVVVPTVGDAVARLGWLLSGMRFGRFDLSPQIILADDGGGFSSEKQDLARLTESEYVKNDDKPGIPGNLNSALKHVTSEWVLVIDDGSSVPEDWFRNASEIARLVFGRRFGGRRVAMCGSSHIQDWSMRAVGMLDKWSVNEWFYKHPELCDAMQRYFRGAVGCPHRIDWHTLESTWHSTSRDRDDDWPDEIKNFMRYNVDRDPILEDDIETEVRRAKYLWSNRWTRSEPSESPLRVNWSPGSQGLLINRQFLDECGGFGHDCVAYEQILACRAAEMGWLSLASDYAPYLHVPSLGFTELGAQKIQPIHRDIYDVCQELYGEPYPAKAVRRFVSAEDDAVVNLELQEATRHA